MKLKPIITSALENDLYKENMSVIILKKCSDMMTRWSWKCRNPDVKFTPEMIHEIREQVDLYCSNVRYTDEDIMWLHTACPWLSNGYLAFLKYWRPNRKRIFINEDSIRAYNNCGLAIEAYGTWLDTTKYEIPILAIVSEVYYAFKYGIGTFLSNDAGAEQLNNVMKMTECNGYPVAKLSNCKGKVMSRNAEYIDYLQRCIDWRLKYDKS